MKNAIILHGKPGREEYYNPEYPSSSNAHWLPWLQKQLLVNDILAHTPEVPRAWQPDYKIWSKEFERYEISSDTGLVGHSCGAGFIIRWLSEHSDIRVGKVVLVAPSFGIDWDHKGFFDFTIDRSMAGRTAGMTIFGSTDDRPGITKSIEHYMSAIDAIHYQEFVGYGHFTFEYMHTDKFPELLQEILRV